MPTVVGAMINSMSGYLSTSANAWLYESSDWSLPYTMSSNSKLAYFGSFSASCIAAIQAFWLAASGEADSTANWPPSAPRMLRAMSALTVPVSSKSTWAMNNCSPSADGMGESQVTTLIPAATAALAAGAIWSPALLEIMIASTPCVVAVVTISICPATLFSGVGPRNCRASGFLSSVAASSAPSCAWSKGRMPRNFGNNTMLTAWPGVALTGSPETGGWVGGGWVGGAFVGGTCVGAAVVAAGPHAARSSIATVNRLTTALRFLFILFLLHGEKCLLTVTYYSVKGGCNRSRASSSFLFSRHWCMAGPTATTQEAARILPPIGDQYRQNQESADDARLGVAGDVDERHPISQIQDEQDRQSNADERSGAAENADAAQQHRGDDVEFKALRRAPPDGAQPGGEQQAGQRGDRRSEERRVGKESRSRWSPY